MKTTFLCACAAVAALFTVSCAPSTPESRIDQRPAAFERLSTKHKELVRRGEIAKGMDKEAVSLAWGDPSGKVDGLRNGKSMERWEYQGQKPVVTNNFFGGYQTGYRYSGLGGGFGPQITYVPYRKSVVWFVKGRVDEWESVR